jgi:hypothetical protein
LFGVTLRQNCKRSEVSAIENFIGVHVADGLVKVERKLEKSAKQRMLA